MEVLVTRLYTLVELTLYSFVCVAWEKTFCYYQVQPFQMVFICKLVFVVSILFFLISFIFLRVYPNINWIHKSYFPFFMQIYIAWSSCLHCEVFKFSIWYDIKVPKNDFVNLKILFWCYSLVGLRPITIQIFSYQLTNWI